MLKGREKARTKCAKALWQGGQKKDQRQKMGGKGPVDAPS